MTWRIEYENDVGPDDGGFWEWWTVTNDERSFKADSKADAEWLCALLNTAPVGTMAPTKGML